MRRPALFLCRLAAAAVAVSTAPAFAASTPRVLPPERLPDDARLAPLKDLDGYFPFTPPASKAEWEARSALVRRRILVSQGLWPMPAKTPLNAVIHGRVDCGEYTVEKVFFESAPGFVVTGNLYRPKTAAGRRPGVLFAHGHWTDARLSESTELELRREIANGEERFAEGGRSRFQSMCVQLVRMGCVVWQWDMLGNSDSQQISMALAHKFARQRPEMNSPDRWGLYSPQAESRLQSVMGLQTLNCIRSLDFLLSLPDVDPERVAMTGASGGGTQTMLLGGIDPRVRLAFPAVMVSTAMQGGCTCENACLLRSGTGNVEFAGLFAPKPLGMTCADDWTREMPVKGFPELKRLYALLGAPEAVMLKRGEHFPHNYNAVSRSAFYGWINRHFKLGFPEPVIERDYRVLSRADLTVWDAQHPAPKAADPDFERSLCHWLDQDARRQITEAAASSNFRAAWLPALEIVLDGAFKDVPAPEWVPGSSRPRAGWIEETGLLRVPARRQELPAVLCRPAKPAGRSVLWLSDTGKAGLYTAEGELRGEIRRLVEGGVAVLGIDLIYQGEFLAGNAPFQQTPIVKNPRESGAYTFGYNPAVFAWRVQDALAAVQFLKTTFKPGDRVSLAALDGSGPCGAAARALCGPEIDRAVLGGNGFRFANVRDLHDPGFLPGGAKYGDLPGLLACAAPAPALVLGEDAASAPVAAQAYGQAGAGDRLRFIQPGATQSAAGLAVEWLMAQ